jgi:large subunit ribosomal protein L23
MIKNPFSKNDKPEAKAKKPETKSEVEAIENKGPEMKVDSSIKNLNKVLKNFYISEKATMLSGMNQYVFKVYDGANKSEIKKQVGAIFKVKVKDVKVLRAPSKSRNVGRHQGTKPGFKKAIVILEKGQTITEGQHRI